MNILVVSQYYYPEPFRINEICEELVRRGHRVTVLTANPNYPDGELYDGYQNVDSREEINGVTVYRCKCRPRYKGAVNLGLNYVDFVIQANRKIMRLDDNFDCVYVYQLSPVTSCLPAIRYKKKKKIPMFLYCLDVWPESLKGTSLEKEPVFSFFKWLSKSIYCAADAIAVSTPSFTDYLAYLCSLDPTTIEYFPQHSISVDNQIKSIGKEYEPDSYFHFLFAGNIGEAQNLESVIRAFKHSKYLENIKFHIVGSGSHYQNCKDLVEELSMSDVVIFHGRHPKSEMAEFYIMADVCLVSLKEEGVVGNTIPGKVQEYMSAGKSILAYMNGDTRQLLNEAKCGYSVAAGDEIELTKKIDYIFENRFWLKDMGNNAQQYFEENFTLDKYVDRVESLLVELGRDEPYENSIN